MSELLKHGKSTYHGRKARDYAIRQAKRNQEFVTKIDELMVRSCFDYDLTDKMIVTEIQELMVELFDKYKLWCEPERPLPIISEQTDYPLLEK